MAVIANLARQERQQPRAEQRAKMMRVGQTMIAKVKLIGACDAIS